MVKQIFSAFFLLFLFTIFGAPVFAQSTVEQAAKNARDQFSDLKNRSMELERMKRESNKRPLTENAASRFPEIKEDFEEIQKINGGIVESTAAKSPINYRAVFKSVSEINRRAIRLKSNLFAAASQPSEEPKNKKHSVVESPNVPTLLETLDKSIDSFVHSSLFQNVNLVNSQDSLKAQNDLETIIEISFSIKEKAKKISEKNNERNF